MLQEKLQKINRFLSLKIYPQSIYWHKHDNIERGKYFTEQKYGARERMHRLLVYITINGCED